jgi:hypothetical protein
MLNLYLLSVREGGNFVFERTLSRIKEIPYLADGFVGPDR